MGNGHAGADPGADQLLAAVKLLDQLRLGYSSQQALGIEMLDQFGNRSPVAGPPSFPEGSDRPRAVAPNS